MSEEDLVKEYAAGRMGRRLFIRKLVAGGVTLGAALAYSNALAPAADARDCTTYAHTDDCHPEDRN